MEIEDLWCWKFDPEPTEGCEIQCPKCEKWTNHKEWVESEVGCEDCGSHTAMECPHCNELFDHIWQHEPFKIKSNVNI